MDYKKLTEEIKAEIKKTLKKSRYEHSIRVAKMCKKLCKKFNLNSEIGYFLGIAHDMCKYYSKEDLISIMQSPRTTIKDILEKIPSLKTKTIDKETYYANSIIDLYNWERLKIEKLDDIRRE